MLSTIYQRIKNIKIPVFQLAFYSSLGYVAYCFYQDYLFKQLTKQIQQEESPISKTVSIYHKIQSTKRTKQLKVFLEDLQIYLDLHLVDPKRRDSVIDFSVVPRQKNQNNKKFWWMSPYETSVKLYSSYFYRSQVKTQGVLAIFFWFDLMTKKSHTLVQSQNMCKVVQNILNKRESICYKISARQEGQNEEYEQCIKQTSKSSGRIQKMVDRMQIIKQYQTQEIL